jgi:hypothetical protein
MEVAWMHKIGSPHARCQFKEGWYGSVLCIEAKTDLYLWHVGGPDENPGEPMAGRWGGSKGFLAAILACEACYAKIHIPGPKLPV